jgi:hypothetical protein
MKLGTNMGTIKDKETKLKRHEQVREKKKKRRENSPALGKKEGLSTERKEGKETKHSSL